MKNLLLLAGAGYLVWKFFLQPKGVQVNIDVGTGQPGLDVDVTLPHDVPGLPPGTDEVKYTLEPREKEKRESDPRSSFWFV